MKSVFRYGLRVVFFVIGTYIVVTAYAVFVPPFAAPPSPVTPEIQSLSAQDNAWTEYQLALDAFDLPDSSTDETIEALKKYANGIQDVLGTAERAYLDEHRGALEHLEAGAKLPHSQLYTQPVTLTTTHPGLLRVRALSSLTTAEARRLVEQGKINEAINLDLMLLKMGTQIAETNSSLVPILIAIYCRGQAIQSLTFLLTHSLQQRHIPDSHAIEINLYVANETAKLNSRMPTPEQACEWEWLSQERYVAALAQGSLQSSAPSRFEKIFVDLPKGLRQRATHDFMQQYPAMLRQFQPALSAWDAQAARETQAQITQQLLRQRNAIWLPRLVSTRAIQHIIPQVAPTLEKLYSDHVAGDTVETLAVVNAFRIAHGRDPAPLSQAFDYAGLPMPTTPNLKVPEPRVISSFGN